ncbi:MAG: LuxR family transcriptional regulator, partial [Chloroflexi bacterium]|nr:LuxR family transcriptional regulator [Chloroflexota bacterium]
MLDLAPIWSRDAVPAALASVLGASEDADRDLIHAIAAILDKRPTLVVLDNFEHVLGARDDVRAILRRATTTTVLTTSRVPLGLAGEHVAELERLTGPASVADVEIAPASAVFLRRARDLGRLTSVDPADADAIVEICHRLDGLPLALELAA